MYLAEDYFTRAGVPEFARTLDEVIRRKRIITHFGIDLREVRPDSREVVFRDLGVVRTWSCLTACCT